MQLPNWFRYVFIALILCFAIFLTWNAVHTGDIGARLEDVKQQLETSRGREARQSKEKDDAEALLPEVKAELEAMLPQKAEAEANRDAMKQARDDARAVNEGLLASITDLQAEKESLTTRHEDNLKRIQEIMNTVQQETPAGAQ